MSSKYNQYTEEEVTKIRTLCEFIVKLAKLKGVEKSNKTLQYFVNIRLSTDFQKYVKYFEHFKTFTSVTGSVKMGFVCYKMYVDDISFEDAFRVYYDNDDDFLYYSVFFNSDIEIEDNSCDSCDGDGWITCHTCDGDTTEECYDCDGSGKLDMEDNEEDCDVCSGDGYVSCSDCYGDGNSECNDCGGSGHYPPSLEFELVYYVSEDHKILDYTDREDLENSDNTIVSYVKTLQVVVNVNDGSTYDDLSDYVKNDEDIHDSALLSNGKGVIDDYVVTDKLMAHFEDLRLYSSEIEIVGF